MSQIYLLTSSTYRVWLQKAGLTLGLTFVLVMLSLTGRAQQDCAVPGYDDLTISEVTADGEVEIFNGTELPIDLSDYFIYTSPSYRELEDLVLDCGDLNLRPGQVLTISSFAGFEAEDGEVALYRDSDFDSAESIVSYLEYGSANHKRAALAVEAGLWSLDDVADPPTESASIQVSVDAAGDLVFGDGAPNLCSADPSFIRTVDAGFISLSTGGTETSICVDGVDDPLFVDRDGTARGPERTFVITDDAGLILGIPGDNGPFNLDPAGPGTCEIWYLAYEPGLEGLAVDNNLSDFAGCYDLSNPITVIRQAPDGGMVELQSGGDVFVGCAGDIIVPVTHTTTATELSYWYIITELDGEILGFANSAETNTLDLSGAPAGICRIWGWSYRGLEDPVIGENISTLTDDSCEAISDNFITVNREIADGGTVTLADGGDEFIGCAGDIEFDVTHTTTGGTLSYWYIITDDVNNILGFANSANTSTLNLSGAAAGTCRVWGWSYRGLPDPVIGEPLTSLTPEGGCADLSDDFITVYREIPDGGTITTSGGASDTTVVAGDAFVTVSHTTTAQFLSYWYIITDDNGEILGFQNSNAGNTLDLSGAPAGVCRIWGWSYRGLDDPIVGEDISTLTDDFCETISEGFVRVVREGADDCDIMTNDISFTDGSTSTSICVDGNADPLEVVRNGGSGNNDATGWIITDTEGNILGVPASPPFDLDPAGVGTCEIWYVRYLTEGFSGLEMGNTLSDLDGCFDLSNPLTVIRQAADGGAVELANGGTDFIGCAGDIAFDVTHTTEATELSYWYIITDDMNNILGFHNSADGPGLELSGAAPGTCRVWGWSYRGLPDPVVGEPLSSLTPEGSCASISGNFITVYREVPDGGTITTAGGAADTTVTAGDAFVTVAHSTTGGFLSYWYIITEEDGTILGFANSANTNTLDLSGAPAGICRIWGWSYRGLGDPVVGENISTLTDDFCEDISDDFVTVDRVDAGGFDFEDVIINEFGANGQIEIFNGTDAAIDVSQYWLCNFPLYTQIRDLTIVCGDMNIQPGGVLVVSNFAYDLADGELGIYTSRRFGDSEAIVSYLEWGRSGHQRASVAIAAGIWEPNFFVATPTEEQSTQTFVSENELTWALADPTFCAVNGDLVSNNLIEQGVGLNVYPNPTTSALTVEIDGLRTEATTFEVFDAAGRKMITQQEDFGNGQTSLDVSSLSPGTYIVRILNGDGFATRRVTVY